MEYREIFYKRTDLFYLYVAEQWYDQQERLRYDYPIVSETFVKVPGISTPGGIRHSVRRHKDFTVSNKSQIVEQCLTDGYFSPRPYRAGQPCDGSIDACVLALLDNFLISVGMNFTELYNAAYPKEQPITLAQLAEIKSFAEWQGVVIPSRWISIELLSESLHAINSHTIAVELENKFTFQNF